MLSVFHDFLLNKTRSNATEVIFDMCYLKTSLYIKFQVNIQYDNRDKTKKKNPTNFKQKVTTPEKLGQVQQKSNLYYLNTNSYTKFQFNTSKDNREKTRKPS